MKQFKLTYLFTFLMSMVGATASADNSATITASDVTIERGKTADVTFTINSESFAAIAEFKLMLPQGVTIKYDAEEEDYAYTLGSAMTLKSHTATIIKQDNGAFYVLVSNSSGREFKAASGDYLTLTLEADETAASGQAVMQEIVVGSLHADKLNTVTRATFNVTVPVLYYELNSDQTGLTVISSSNNDKYSGDVVIPETAMYNGKMYSVTAIGTEAFWNCDGLTSITIPNSVTAIGDEAFAYCSGLTSIIVKSGNNIYDSRDNCNAIIETASNMLIAGCSATVIPNSVTAIGSTAFLGCSGLTSVTIPNSVKVIGVGAFSGCSGLSSVTIPKGVTTIGAYAFANCNITSINVENGNNIYDSRDNCNAIIETASNKLISGCSATVIPNSVTTIGDYAFYFCKGLTSINIPNGVTAICGSAFGYCYNLTTVIIPSSVTAIGNYAFYNCNNLTDLFCYAENVPSAGNGTFVGDFTLHVPAASISAYKSQAPWSDFNIVSLPRCATPTITYVDGKMSFSCETEDVTYTYNITNNDIKGGNADEVQLTGVYLVTVYASKEGYDNSNAATIEIPLGVIKGDLDGDNRVNALDIQEVINIASTKD